MTFPILKKLKAIDINAELNIVLKSLESQILAMNTDDQLFKKGVTIEGVKIVPPYTPFTKAIKRRKGQPTNRVTTRDTGQYHKNFKVHFRKDEFYIDVIYQTNEGDIASKLRNKYGDLEGLTDENVIRLSKMIQPLLIDAIKKRL
jgi:hypothetical protein